MYIFNDLMVMAGWLRDSGSYMASKRPSVQFYSASPEDIKLPSIERWTVFGGLSLTEDSKASPDGLNGCNVAKFYM